jgi:Ca2+-binding EF-hand superfamily protein
LLFFIADLYFAVFDKDMSGFVSSSELKFVMSNLGVNFTDEELLEMMIEVTVLQQFIKMYLLK